jgi:hypothetical protein
MRLFISYRRDDAAGFAGRLEASLEQRLGAGAVFRDLEDIPPGEDFAATIRARLATAQGVLVLIGPRWAGGDVPGQRRLDDAGDFVRLEVQAALASGARVVPVLLPGAQMPTAASLPEPLRALADRNATTIGGPHWDADVDRLLAGLGLVTRRAIWPWAAGAALIAGGAVAAVCGLWPVAGDGADRLLGHWEADVRYDWGDRHAERFHFERHAGGLTGTASFLGVPRVLENLRVDDGNLHFETRTEQSMGDATRTVTHAYAAELQGAPPAERLVFRLHSTGGFSSHRPVTFEAARAASAPPS